MKSFVVFVNRRWIVMQQIKYNLLQASDPLLLLQPDCPLRAHLLNGSPWIHSSTWLRRETHTRFSSNHLNQTYPASFLKTWATFPEPRVVFKLSPVNMFDEGGRFPRVFGDEFGDKFGEKYGDSLNLVKTLVTNLVTKLVNHQIWWRFWWQILWQI